MRPDMELDFPERDIARLEMLSDGVFAIAITLLGLELRAPRPEDLHDSTLLHFLGSQWHTYLAVVTSFFTILVVWLNHHGCILAVRRVNVRFIMANGLLLLAVICFPFVTGLLGEYFTTPHARAASGVYAGVCLLSNIAFNLMWSAAAKDRALIKDEVPASLLRAIRINALIGFGAYFLAAVSAVISAYLAIGICTFLWIFWTLTFNHFREKARVLAAAR